ncbi:MAG: OPT/YSL family transporter [Candidatus Baldrarchaeia archaeon]
MHTTENRDPKVRIQNNKVKNKAEITKRGLILSSFLNALYTLINSYLGLNFGIGLGFSLVTILLAYTLFHVIMDGTSKQEITTIVVASSGFTAWWIIATSIYIRIIEPESNLPTWLAPSLKALVKGSMLSPEWIVPILVNIFLIIIPSLLGLIVGLAVADVVLKNKRMVFPFQQITGVTINTCLDKGRSVKFLFMWMGIGFILTFLQYLLAILGLQTISIDWTPNLPKGYAFGFMINLAIIGVSFIIHPSVSLTLLLAGLAVYFILAPIAIKMGLFTPARTGMEFYMNMLFQFSLSPALGIFLLSGLIILLVKKVQAKKNGGKGNDEIPSLSITDYTRAFIRELKNDKRLRIAYITLTSMLIAFTIYMGVFNPMSFETVVFLSIFLIIPMGIIDSFIIVKMVGEAGISMGAQRIIFYQVPIAALGGKGYTPYIAYPAISPWDTSMLLGSFKIGEITETSRKAILKAYIFNYVPGIITSIIFILVAWYFVGFPSEIFPAVGLIQIYAIYKMFAERSIQGVLDPRTFIIGGVVGGILGALTPISPMGIALALLLPPSYILPFGLGGILRVYTDKKYGKKWFEERGQLIATGFIAGAIITQILMAIVMAVVQ